MLKIPDPIKTPIAIPAIIISMQNSDVLMVKSPDSFARNSAASIKTSNANGASMIFPSVIGYWLPPLLADCLATY
jgi:hypothetical protein